MQSLDFHASGRHFLQIPGPSPVPDRILRAMSLPTIDHRGPEFGVLGLKVLSQVRQIFQTQHPVIIYPASGTGAWEAALCNVTSPGDHLLMYETGHFATLWKTLATRLGLQPEFIGGQGDFCEQQALGEQVIRDGDLLKEVLGMDQLLQLFESLGHEKQFHRECILAGVLIKLAQKGIVGKFLQDQPRIVMTG